MLGLWRIGFWEGCGCLVSSIKAVVVVKVIVKVVFRDITTVVTKVVATKPWEGLLCCIGGVGNVGETV